MPSLTLRAAAKAASQYLGVLDSGESLSSVQETDALDAANAMLDSWSLEQLMVPSLLVQLFGLTNGVQGYTIGAGQTFNVARPVDIISGVSSFNTAAGSTVQFPVIAIDAVKWASIPDRAMLSNIQRVLFYDRQLPNGKVYFSPIPLGGQIELTMWSALTQFATVTGVITVPPGYVLPIELALAMVLAPQFDVEPTSVLVNNYRENMARLRKLNAGLVGNPPVSGEVSPGTEPPTPVVSTRAGSA